MQTHQIQWFLFKIHHNACNWKLYCVEIQHRQKQIRNALHTIKITPNLLFAYQCTSGKFIRLPNRIEKNRFGSENRIESKLCPNWNAVLQTNVRLCLVSSVSSFLHKADTKYFLSHSMLSWLIVTACLRFKRLLKARCKKDFLHRVKSKNRESERRWTQLISLLIYYFCLFTIER